MKLIQAIHDYDVYLFFWVMRRKSQKWLVRFARCISHSADGYLYLGLAAFLAWDGSAESYRFLACMLLALFMERPLYFIIKNAFRRDRPTAAFNIKGFVVPSDKFSFPSGHTSAAFLMACLIGSFHPELGPVVLTWATLVGAARVVLGVHFPTDTLVGAVMGSTMAFLSMETLLF